MPRIAFLSTAELCAGTHPDPAENREHRLQVEALAGACAERDLELVPVPWDDPGFEPASVAAIVLGTAWDYAARADLFLDRLRSFAESTRLFNPLPLVRWNLEKTYLRALEQRGARIVPTRWCERADPAAIEAAFEAFACERVVVKPVVGQSAWRQALVTRGEPLPTAEALPPAGTLIQPFLPSIRTEGELSLLFVDGEFSHAVRKRPVAGDYRIQGNFGGTDEPHEPSPDDLVRARDVIAALHEPPLYARVDMVRDLEGELALMELELIEPYLYPRFAPALGPCFAEALARRLRHP